MGRHPQINFRPCRLRLVRYSTGSDANTLGPTLLDPRRNPVSDLADLYHGGQGVAQVAEVFDDLVRGKRFVGQSVRTVKQELFARFGLVALERLSALR